MRKAPNLSISPEKVFFIVAKARQSEGSAAELDSNSGAADDGHGRPGPKRAMSGSRG